MALHTRKLNGIAACAGNGGLELGLKLALGDQYKTVCYIEREAYNARTLVARMDDALLDRAPVWDDITTFDGRPWRGIVDILSAGFPCQPHSAAGKRQGTKDERWIWNDIARTISQSRPGYIFLENVPDLAFSGLDRVLSSLSEAGYSSVWDTFSAEETGASQIRERLFIFSYTDSLFDRSEQTERQTGRNALSSGNRQDLRQILSDGLRNVGEAREIKTGRQTRATVDKRGKRIELVHSVGFGGETTRLAKRVREFEPSGTFMDNGSGKRRQIGRQERLSGRRTVEHPNNFIFPPFRDDYEKWKDYLAERPDAQPAILRGSDGLANRMDEIRTIGNGVVPLVAAFAFITLARTALRVEENKKL